MDYCKTCIYYPPSSCDGKPCTQCDPESPFQNCYVKKEADSKVREKVGVLIKGMEMPKNCFDCMFHWHGDGTTYCLAQSKMHDLHHIKWQCKGYEEQMKYREPTCPLVPVPPHGRFLKVLKTERECVSRDCNRDCGKCDLSLEQDEILSAYNTLIALFADPAEEG